MIDARLPNRQSILHVVAALTLCIAAAIGQARANDEAVLAGQDFGAGLTLTETSSLSEVVTHPEKYADRAVLVRGQIVDVCQRKGCWMVLRDRDVHVRVRFQDYEFFVPTDSSDKQAYVEGRVSRQTLSERQARHYAEESRKDDPKQLHGEQQVVSFTATGVRIVD